MSIEIKIADESDSREWNRIVENSPHGTIFHTWKWLKLMGKHSSLSLLGKPTKSRLYPLICFKGGEAIGVFPLFYCKKFFIKFVFSPPEMVETLYSGPVLASYDRLEQRFRSVESAWIGFQKKVDEFISQQFSPNWILINSSPGLLDSRPFKWTGYEVGLKYTYVINLSNGMDNLWKQTGKKNRQEINRAIKEGIYMEEGSRKELNLIYESIVKRRRKQCVKPTCSYEYLIDVYNSFHPQNLRVFVVKFNSEYLGGIICTCYKDKLYLWVGSHKAVFKGASPNYLLWWKIIGWAHENNFKYCDLLGADNYSLYQFKSKFKGNLIPYFSYKKCSPSVIKILKELRQIMKYPK